LEIEQNSSLSISEATTVETENLTGLRKELDSAEFQQEFLFGQTEDKDNSLLAQLFVPNIQDLTQRIAALSPYTSTTIV
jgi:hypothetical protein